MHNVHLVDTDFSCMHHVTTMKVNNIIIIHQLRLRYEMLCKSSARGSCDNDFAKAQTEFAVITSPLSQTTRETYVKTK